MSELKITGTIEKIMEQKGGVSKSGKEWKSIEFVIKTEDEFNNLYCFKVFGFEKVDNFLKYNKENDMVDVSFNINTREYEGRYFTNLDAWKIFSSKMGESAEKLKALSNKSQDNIETESDDLPF